MPTIEKYSGLRIPSASFLCKHLDTSYRLFCPIPHTENLSLYVFLLCDQPLFMSLTLLLTSLTWKNAFLFSLAIFSHQPSPTCQFGHIWRNFIRGSFLKSCPYSGRNSFLLITWHVLISMLNFFNWFFSINIHNLIQREAEIEYVRNMLNVI